MGPAIFILLCSATAQGSPWEPSDALAITLANVPIPPFPTKAPFATALTGPLWRITVPSEGLPTQGHGYRSPIDLDRDLAGKPRDKGTYRFDDRGQPLPEGTTTTQPVAPAPKAAPKNDAPKRGPAPAKTPKK